jgi:hypothetical protein
VLLCRTRAVPAAGELNVSTSLVDDEGVDLVFHRRDSMDVHCRVTDSR